MASGGMRWKQAQSVACIAAVSLVAMAPAVPASASDDTRSRSTASAPDRRVLADPEQAPIVVEGRVEKVTPWETSQGLIFSDILVHVEEVAHGSAPPSLIVQQGSGELDGVGFATSHGFSLADGGTYRLALARLPDGLERRAERSYYVVGARDGVTPLEETPPLDPLPVPEGGALLDDSDGDGFSTLGTIHRTSNIASPLKSGCQHGFCVHSGPIADSELPWTYDVNWNSMPGTLDPANANHHIFVATQRWASDQNGSSFPSPNWGGKTNRSGFNFDDVNTVSWVSSSSLPADCPYNQKIACTGWWTDTTTGNIIESDTEFFRNRRWCVMPCSNQANSYDVQTVMLHEFGHSLSFAHVSSDSVMVPEAPLGSIRRHLFLADRNGVMRQYPPDTLGYEYVTHKNVNPSPMIPSRSYPVWIRLKNRGSESWPIGGLVRLGTSNPLNRTSPFNNGCWMTKNRVALTRNISEGSSSRSVQPGQVGQFSWSFCVPKDYPAPSGSKVEQNREYFRPLAESMAWMPDAGLYLRADVGSFRGSFVSKTGRQTRTSSSEFPVSVRIKNTGTGHWRVGQDPLRIGTRSSSPYRGSDWLSSRRASRIDRNVTTGRTSGWVSPDQVAEFTLNIDPGSVLDPGLHHEDFEIRAEWQRWFTEVGKVRIEWCMLTCVP